MIIDNDTKPKETILYLSAIMLLKLKTYKKINVTELDDLFKEINPNQPAFKFQLALNFLFLMNKIDIKGGQLSYVP